MSHFVSVLRNFSLIQIAHHFAAAALLLRLGVCLSAALLTVWETCQGKFVFPLLTPPCLLPFRVVDLLSLCLPSEKSTRAFSATEQRQRQAVLPTQKNITANSQTHTHTRYHTHTHILSVCMSDDHALASQAD